MLDLWLPGGAVELIAYADSIDFGAKGYGNLAELALVQHHVADELDGVLADLKNYLKSYVSSASQPGRVRQALLNGLPGDRWRLTSGE